MESKSTLRRKMRDLRRAVTPAARAVASSAICRAILARDDVRAAVARKGVFAVYLASSEEIDLTDLIAALRAANVPIAAPRWNGEVYTLARYDGDRVQEGPHHILEPQDDVPVDPASVAVWILPGLAFTRAGGRLGYGGGWYDRFLAAADPAAITLGVAYPFQIVETLPTEPHDRRICAIITP